MMHNVPAPARSVSVILCAYTQRRWLHLLAAVASVRCQTQPAAEIIIVIDHNADLLAEARATWPALHIIENSQLKGLSGARNSGVAVAKGEIIAFLDDDAVAAPDWLEQLAGGYQTPKVLGVGGAAEPIWPKRQVGWLPEEFFWVIGCSYRGMPQTDAHVRNFIGCNMSFRRDVFQVVGAFCTGMGRVDTYPAGCEETEFCIRLKQADPQGLLLYKPAARVAHHVTKSRLTPGYFLHRCFAEGLSKAMVTRSVGSQAGLVSERDYTLKVLPRSVVHNVAKAVVERKPMKLARAGAILAGFSATVAGYLKGAVSARMRSVTLKTSRPGKATPFIAARMLELELAEPLPELAASDPETGFRYTRAAILVRRHSQPLGVIEVELGAAGIGAAELERLLRDSFGADVDAASETATLARPASAGYNLTGEPSVSVVIATHNRTQSLATCLASLAQSTYPDYEVIVVDNAPSSSETFDYIQHTLLSPRIRYIREDTPGLAVAHNRGLREARGKIVAFTDDDVRVDRHWLTKLVEGFALAENVGCVTGMIVPAELETQAQAWLEQYGGFNKGFEVGRFNLTDHHPRNPLYPYTAGMFGSGANMAFTREALYAIGGFDPALGAGSKGIGGDDLASFFDIVNHGFTLVYQPAAIVHHWHRRDYEGLRRQAYGYGVGLTAFLTKTVMDQPRRLFDILPRLPLAVVYAFSPASPKNAKKQADYPKELSRFERKGMVYGPLAYLRSRWHLRKLGGTYEKLSPLPAPQKA